MTRADINRRYYDKKRRKVHGGRFLPDCKQPGRIAKSGEAVTCKTCVMIAKTREVGKRINEWDQKRLDVLFRARTAEKSRRWRLRNLEKARAASRNWHARNRDIARVLQREWAEKNREHKNATWRAWWHRNKAKQVAA